MSSCHPALVDYKANISSIRFPVDIFVHVMEQSDWRTLASWRATSRACFSSVAICLRLRYRAHVSPFVGNVELFNDVLTRHCAIISGSVALHYFTLDPWTPGDLDVYVPDAQWHSFVGELAEPTGLAFTRCTVNETRRKAAALKPSTESLPTGAVDGTPSSSGTAEDEPPSTDGENLPLLDGQRVVTPSATGVDDGSDATESVANSDYGSDDDAPLPLPSAYIVKGLRDVRKFVTPTGLYVDVIRSPTASPVTPLRFFWSTLVMNFITPTACVCAYPSATLARTGVLKQGKLRPRDRAAIAKYEDERGFFFVGDEWRDAVDMWDYLFFGERNLLALDYRVSPSEPRADLPVTHTPRGWVPSTSVDPHLGECIAFFAHAVADRARAPIGVALFHDSAPPSGLAALSCEFVQRAAAEITL